MGPIVAGCIVSWALIYVPLGDTNPATWGSPRARRHWHSGNPARSSRQGWAHAVATRRRRRVGVSAPSASAKGLETFGLPVGPSPRMRMFGFCFSRSCSASRCRRRCSSVLQSWSAETETARRSPLVVVPRGGRAQAAWRLDAAEGQRERPLGRAAACLCVASGAPRDPPESGIHIGSGRRPLARSRGKGRRGRPDAPPPSPLS